VQPGGTVDRVDASTGGHLARASRREATAWVAVWWRRGRPGGGVGGPVVSESSLRLPR